MAVVAGPKKGGPANAVGHVHRAGSAARTAASAAAAAWGAACQLDEAAEDVDGACPSCKMKGRAAVRVRGIHPAAARQQHFGDRAVVGATPRRQRSLAAADGGVVQRRLVLRIKLWWWQG